MNRFFAPPGYRPALGLYETQKAIVLVKRVFEDTLAGALRLRRVSAPLFVMAGSGLNDDLSGVERAVSFDIPAAGAEAQVVHSLAKWKRMALAKYGFSAGRGLYTDMNAIRRDETLDNIHSVYVDQWDWERVITREDRTRAFLEQTARAVVESVCAAEQTLRAIYPQLERAAPLCPDMASVTTQELEDRWPSLSPRQREDAFLQEHKTALLIGIGGALRSGEKHDGRAPDYDDWSLNGDILFWSERLGRAMELSSMGIRVDEASLRAQLRAAGCEAREALPFHQALLRGELPLTVGGGIGQSRLCMLLLDKAHIGEVQVSVWDEETLRRAAEAGIPIL